jgi:hypothetical protein
MKCSICLSEIEVGPGGWSEGHNAAPITEGRCCGECNDTVVIPARLAVLFARLNSNKEGSAK